METQDNFYTPTHELYKPLGCPFCDADVERPVAVTREVMVMEMGCKPCNLVMRKEVTEMSEAGKLVATMQLLSKWTSRVKQPGANPIPGGTWFDPDRADFFCTVMKFSRGEEFKAKWLPRVGEFPKREEDARGWS